MQKIQILLFISLIISCSSPLDKKFSEETAENDISAIKEEIDSTEIMLLAGNMIRLKFQNKKLENMTYQEILDDGKKWKAEQEKIELEQRKLAEKAKRKEELKSRKLSESILVSCFEKSFIKYDYQEYITYKFVIKTNLIKKFEL